MFTNNDENNGNSGNRGKFSDRINKIRRDLFKKSKNTLPDDGKQPILVSTRTNVFKVFISIPLIVYNNVVNMKDNFNNGKKEIKKNNVFNDLEKVSKYDFQRDDVSSLTNKSSSRYKSNYSKKTNVSLKKMKNCIFQKKVLFNTDNSVKETNDINCLKLRKIELQKEIINLIKKKLVKSINEFEMLQSEFYVLSELENEDIYVNECQTEIQEIKKLLSKVKSLKEKYDFLKENVDFEYIFEYDDDLLIDKIIELKRLCSIIDLNNTVNDYKILDEYQFLYLKIDKLQDKAFKLEEEKRKKEEELKQRDIDFDKMKESIFNVYKENERYINFVREQELLLKQLDENILFINSFEQTSYRLKGFGHLLGNSFKYLGLLLVNPLKGLVPGIATQTLITKNIIHNLYNNLEWEENKKIVYDTIDYSILINSAINNLDVTSSLIDSTLEDIIKLKRKYMEKFGKYEGYFSEYQDAIKKMNKIENAILSSKIKINIMKQKMLENEKKNSSKLKKVKKLNDFK